MTFFIVEVIKKKLEPVSELNPTKEKKVVGIMSYYNGLNAPIIIRNGINIDLIRLRTQIAIEGSKLSKMDVYGKGWPKEFLKRIHEKKVGG